MCICYHLGLSVSASMAVVPQSAMKATTSTQMNHQLAHTNRVRF